MNLRSFSCACCYGILNSCRYFQEVLNCSILPSDCNEITLNKDGTWSIQQEKKVMKTEKPTIIGLDDSTIEIIGDDIGKLLSKLST